MKFLSFFLIGSFFVGGVFAQAKPDPQTLMKKYNCHTCHEINKKLVGPSYKEVASKYKKDKNAELFLPTRIIKGTQGRWGQVPMPPNTQVPEQDAKILAKWILSL